MHSILRQTDRQNEITVLSPGFILRGKKTQQRESERERKKCLKMGNEVDHSFYTCLAACKQGPEAISQDRNSRFNFGLAAGLHACMQACKQA